MNPPKRSKRKPGRLNSAPTTPKAIPAMSARFMRTGRPPNRTLICCLDALPSGMGGTGIVNDYGGRDGMVKFRDRLDWAVIAKKPDVVVIAGGVNDSLMVANGTVTPSHYRSEYDALIREIKRGLPEAKIVVLGPFCPGTPSSYRGMTQIRDLNRAAARAAGVPFIDVFYFTDATRERYTSDVDDFHLNDAGYEYLGKKLGADLNRVLRQR